MVSIDMCDERCGYLAAFVSCLSFGSFCVPMKSDAAKSVDVDPLVFQSYKTMMCLITSFFVLLLDPNPTFTYWGLVSGLFWVPAGTVHVLAVRTAGLAIAAGTCSSCIVLVSFIWGIFIFHESVKSVTSACSAIALMIFGICGMAYFSSTSPSSDTKKEQHNIELDTELQSLKASDEPCADHLIQQRKTNSVKNNTSSSEIIQTENNDEDEELATKGNGGSVAMIKSFIQYLNENGIDLNQRQLGTIVAAVGGFYGGSVLVPLHYAPSNTKGFTYVFSFAVGASFVNVMLWVLRFGYYFHKKRSFSVAYNSLPSFHVRSLLLPGATSGILWSLGNFASIISVSVLGEGVGYSMTQSAMFISGLWAIFYFGEITDTKSIQGWFLSATITITGILFLCYNHVPASHHTKLESVNVTPDVGSRF